MKVNAAAFAVLVLVTSPAAAADNFRGAPPPAVDAIQPYEVMTIIRSTGLRPAARPIFTGSVYTVRAIDAYGKVMRVTVDAQLGEVLSVEPVPVAGPRYDPYWGSRAMPPDVDDDLPPPAYGAFGRDRSYDRYPRGYDRGMPPPVDARRYPPGALPPGAIEPDDDGRPPRPPGRIPSAGQPMPPAVAAPVRAPAAGAPADAVATVPASPNPVAPPATAARRPPPAVTHSVTATPAKLPLPRPRPTIASAAAMPAEASAAPAPAERAPEAKAAEPAKPASSEMPPVMPLE